MRALRIAAFRIKKKCLTTGGEKVNLEYAQILENMNGVQVDYLDWQDIGLQAASEMPGTKLYKIWMAFRGQFLCVRGCGCWGQYDAVIFGSFIGMRIIPLLSTMKKKYPHTQLVCILHHYLCDEYKNVKRILTACIQSRVLYLSDQLLYTCYPIYDETIRRNLQPVKKCRYIGICFDKQIREDTSPIHGNILCISSIMRHKGIHRLVQACTLMKGKAEFHVDIVGRVMEDEYANSLKQYCNANGLKDIVSFHGRISEEEKEQMLLEADIFAFPSLQEGFGIAMIEAMEKGIPVVAFNNSAIPYTVKNEENGLLVQEDNVQGFADALLRIISDDALRERLSAGAYLTAKECPDRTEVEHRLEKFVGELSV